VDLAEAEAFLAPQLVRPVSEQVLEAIARALLLDDAEREPHRPRTRRLGCRTDPTSPEAFGPRSHDAPEPAGDARCVIAGPAFVRNRMDLLAANRMARAFYSDVYADPRRPANLARFTFLDSAGLRFYPDWDFVADITVAILRTEAGRNPHDPLLHDLVGELSTRRSRCRRWRPRQP
jgi:hypothetical protein